MYFKQDLCVYLQPYPNPIHWWAFAFLRSNFFSLPSPPLCFFVVAVFQNILLGEQTWVRSDTMTYDENPITTFPLFPPTLPISNSLPFRFAILHVPKLTDKACRFYSILTSPCSPKKLYSVSDTSFLPSSVSPSLSSLLQQIVHVSMLSFTNLIYLIFALLKWNFCSTRRFTEMPLPRVF